MSSFGGASIEATGAIPCKNQGFVHRLQEAVLENIGFIMLHLTCGVKGFPFEQLFRTVKWPVGARNPICWSLPSMAVKRFLLVSGMISWVDCCSPVWKPAFSLVRSVMFFLTPTEFWCWFLVGWTPTVVSQWRLHVLLGYFELNASVFLRKFRSSLLGWNLADENVFWVNYNDFTWKRWVQKAPFFVFPEETYVLLVFLNWDIPRSSMPASTRSVTCSVLGNNCWVHHHYCLHCLVKYDTLPKVLLNSHESYCPYNKAVNRWSFHYRAQFDVYDLIFRPCHIVSAGKKWYRECYICMSCNILQFNLM